MVIALCLLPVPSPTISSRSQSAKRYFKKPPTTNTPLPILVQIILLLLPKSLIHADTLRVLILTTSTIILSDNLSTSNYFFSLSQWDREMYFSSGNIDNSMYSRLCCYRSNIMGGCRLAVPVPVTNHVWGLLTLVFWRCSCLASFRCCSLLNGLQNGLNLLYSLFLASLLLFLEWSYWGSLCQNIQTESVNFPNDTQIIFFFLEILIFIFF